jgi:phospholipase C
LTAPAPDNSKSYPDPFNFTRVGIRVPTLLISPWIKKGTIISAPTAAQKPASDSQFELTSILATMKKMFGLPSFLTKRDAWAATFDDYLHVLDSPRTDCPLHLPEAPTSLTPDQAAWEGGRPLNDLQVWM